MTVEQAIGEPMDQFPIGMRVLAVDDDPTCLMVLETLLRRCQYHVTTTNQAIMALKMLRESKDKFDLVISDVHMPDMDGFKLLELVGLEMDLPVIMLSAYGDPKLVMKGITHGACDYLLKPVRIEELKNIWQHVVRRRKSDNKQRSNNSDNKEGPNIGSGEAAETLNSEQNGGKVNKKRKDQNDEEDEEKDENGHENDDPSTQKKPRVVWSVELHRKFVAAVNQLGIDKAVPKKILDLMNVDKLTRENVASHLQKYRLYLKRISCVANQQANMAAVLGSTDPSYLQMGSSLNGLGSFHRATMPVGSGQFPGAAALRSFPPNGMLGRLNSPAGLGVRGLSSPGMFLSNPSDSGKFPPVSLPGGQNNGGNILQGMPMPLELDQLQTNNNKGISNNVTAFPASSSFPTQNPLIGVPNNLLVLEGHPQESQNGRIFGNQSSPAGASLNSGFSSQFAGHQNNRLLENWSGAVPASTLHPINMTSQNGSRNNQFDVSSISPVIPMQLPHSKGDTQEWNVHNNSINYPVSFSSDDTNARTLERNLDYDSTAQSGFLDPLPMRQADVVGHTTEASVNSTKEGYLMGQQKLQSNFLAGAGSLDDIVNAMVKQEQNHTDVSEADLGFNTFSSLRTCL